MQLSLRSIKTGKHNVLLLDYQALRAYGLVNGVLEEIGKFAADDIGHELFRQYLADSRPSALYLIVDSVAEDYLIETMAHVGANDRRQLLKRKLDQHFRGGEYRHAAVIGRESTGRRDDRVLFSALSKNQLVDPWVRCILQEEIPLRAITSTAFVISDLMKSMNLLTSPAVLVANWESHGIRQTFLRNGKTVFSRLSSLPARDDQNDPVVYVGSICTQTREYLERSKLLGFTEALDVHVFAAELDEEDVGNISKGDDLTQFFQHDAEAFADAGKYWGEDEQLTVNLLCIQHVMRSRAPANIYAPPVARRFHYLQQARQAIYGCCAAVVLAGFALAGPVFSEVMDQRRRYQQIFQQTVPLQEQYAVLRDGFPQTPIPSLAMELAVTTYDRLRDQAHDPSALLISVSRVLTRFPGINLSSVEWALTPENIDDSLTDALLNDSTEVSLDLRGEIAAGTGFLNTDRDLRRLIAELERIDNVTVTPVTLPIETSEYASVSATIGDDVTSAPFVLNIRQRSDP